MLVPPFSLEGVFENPVSNALYPGMSPVASLIARGVGDG